LTAIFFQGDAPTIGIDAFLDDDAAVYYLSGTTGWEATLGGLPTRSGIRERKPTPAVLASAQTNSASTSLAQQTFPSWWKPAPTSSARGFRSNP